MTVSVRAATEPGETPPDTTGVTGAELSVFALSPYARGGHDSASSATFGLDQGRTIAPVYGNLGLGRQAASPDGFASRPDEGEVVWLGSFDSTRNASPLLSEAASSDLSPAIAAEFGPGLQVGAGIDLMSVDAGLRQFDPWLHTAVQERRERADTDALGIGGRVGLGLQITEHQRLGLSYRTPVNIDYRGDLQLYNGSPVLGGGVFRTEMKTQIKLPTIIAAGYGINLTDKLRLEAEVEWLRYSKFRDLPLLVANGLPGLPGSVNEHWRDIFSVGFGGHYRLGEHWLVRAGYQFYQSPVPDSAFSPAIPDAEQNVFSVGIRFNQGNHALEAAYGADFYNTRKLIDGGNAASNGTESFAVHLFSLSYRCVF